MWFDSLCNCNLNTNIYVIFEICHEKYKKTVFKILYKNGKDNNNIKDTYENKKNSSVFKLSLIKFFNFFYILSIWFFVKRRSVGRRQMIPGLIVHTICVQNFIKTSKKHNFKKVEGDLKRRSKRNLL